MSLRRPLVLIAIVATLALVLGCSGGNSTNPVTPGGSANSMDSLPIIGLTDANGVFDAIGVLGFYELDLNPDTMTADLTTPRMASVGESFVVSAAGFFTVAPCPDCLDVKSLDIMSDGTIKVTWNISHPFPYGTDDLPPKANNRRDLDLFDLALVIAPTSETATAFATGGAYAQICAKADGYTADLATVADAPPWACPYFLVIDECNAAPMDVTSNRFLMGTTDLEFDTFFKAGGLFKVYLTCGYGAAAKKATFLTPTYFIPEFNRKAAWKVVVTPPNGNDPPSSMNTWNNTNNDPIADVHLVKVEVYDWQQTAPVYSGDPTTYGTDAAVNEIYAPSSVSLVTLEIPGMFTSPGYKMMTAADSGTGAPGSPLVFNFNVTNETLIPVGVYPSLVKVTDSRPGQDPLGGVETRDWIIDSPDGIALNHSALSEFATYQVFDAAVVQFCGPITGSITTPGPITGVWDDGYAIVAAFATSTNGGAPIIDYQWDMDYDGITFDVDKHGANTALGPYDNPNCGTPPEDPVTYTAACRALDSCIPPNILLLGTIDIVVDDCSGSPVVPVDPVPIISGDVLFDLGVQPGSYIYLLADRPSTGNVGGDGATGTRTILRYNNDLTSPVLANPGTGIAHVWASWHPFPNEVDCIDAGTAGQVVVNYGGQAAGSFTMSGDGLTATPNNASYNWCGTYDPDIPGFDVVYSYTLDVGGWLWVVEELPSVCASFWSPDGDAIIGWNDPYTGAYSNSGTGITDPGYDLENNLIACDGFDGTNNAILFMHGPTQKALVEYTGPIVGSPGSWASTGVYYDGLFVGASGLDICTDSANNILTLETPGIFTKFDNTYTLVWVGGWTGPGIPARMDFDEADNELYVLSSTHITRCLVF
jgi:hypothetical protein